LGENTTDVRHNTFFGNGRHKRTQITKKKAKKAWALRKLSREDGKIDGEATQRRKEGCCTKGRKKSSNKKKMKKTGKGQRRGN